MKLITFLMTDKRIEAALANDKGLIALSELWDKFNGINYNTDAIETLRLIGEDEFGVVDALIAVENQLVAYIQEATNDHTYFYSNAVNHFSTMADVVEDAYEGLLTQVSLTANYY